MTSLTVAGSINMDLVARVPKIPAPGETLLGRELVRHHGGKGANQAVAAARLGAAVSFFGAVGDDIFGSELLQGLRDEGIAVPGVARVAGASGAALINVGDDGENAISVLPGANLRAPLPADDWHASALLLQLEIPLAITLAWALAARRCRAAVLLNAAPFAPLPLQLLQATDVLIVNEGEWAALEAQVSHDVAARQAVDRLPWRVVTRGAAGVLAHSRDGARIELAGVPVDVLDTTGAGDTFCGALAAGLVGGRPFAEALARANRAAGLACTAAGARGGMPRLEQLEAALAAR